MNIKPITAERNSAVRQSSAVMKSMCLYCSTISNGKIFGDNLLGATC